MFKKLSEDAEENIQAADLPEISESTISKVEAMYNEQVSGHVYHLW